MRTYILGIFLFISVLNWSQTTILFEDFNNGFPAGWQMVDEDGVAPYNSPGVNFITDAYVITEDYDSIGMTDSILVATSWLETETEARDYLILPQLSLGLYGNYLSFDAKSVDASHPDRLDIRVSTGGVGLWEFFTLEAAYSNYAVPADWANYTVSLDSLGITGQDVFICFFHVCTDQYILALDNIKVYIDDPVSVAEVTNDFNVYPNPSNGSFSFSQFIDAPFQVVDLSGRMIIQGNQLGYHLDLSAFSKGMYWLKVEGAQPTQLMVE